MKFYAVFALLIAGISSFPGTEAIIEDQIIDVIEGAKDTLRELGLDPLIIKREGGAYSLPVPVIFNAGGYCEDVLSTGISDIVINNVQYDILGFRLTLDLEMPHIHLSVGGVFGEAVIFGNEISGQGSGSIDVYNARVQAVANVGILGGITIRSIDVDSSIAAINSDIRVVIQDYDLSDFLNNFLGETVLATLEAFKPEIDELIGIVLTDYINDNILG